jgi:DNA-binding IclR family transcriptional regulator
VTRRAELRTQLEHIRETGYALAVDELETGLTAAAAPIRNAHGDIIASMSISGPTFRLTGEKLAEAIPLLVTSATEVSHRLGWGQRT